VDAPPGRLIESSWHHPNNPAANRRAGWRIFLADSLSQRVVLYVGDGAIFMLGRDEVSTGPIAFNTTSSYHVYDLVVTSDGAVLRVDGNQLGFVARSDFGTSGSSNAMHIGDGTVNEYSSSRLRWFRLDVAGTPAGIDSETQPLAARFELVGAEPNPFGLETAIHFRIPASARLTLRIYDAGGRVVRMLLDRAVPAGGHRVVWNGRDGNGHRVSPGIYFYHVRDEGEGIGRVGKLVLLK
jgi:hypothetical protein